MLLSPYEDNIVRYYEQCQIDYQLVWHLKKKMCMHYGYWDNDTSSLSAALINMNDKVAALAGISKEDFVLDAGCGVGGLSVYLAKTIGCRTKGITISEKQVKNSIENASKEGVSHLCSFEKANYVASHLPEASFDVVLAVESVCYALNKLDFLNEAYRLLKPGGRLVVADFYSSNNCMKKEDEALMENWTATWAIKAYADIQVFWEQLAEAGFINRFEKDVTTHVEKSIRRLYQAFFPGIMISTVSEWLGFRNKMQTANTWSTFYQYKAYKKQLWKYMFFSAEKPLT